MPELPREHAQLTPVVRLMRDEIIQKVHHIGRKILPYRRRNRSATRGGKLDQINHPTTTPRQRTQQRPWLHSSAINRLGNDNTMTRTDHLDPHAPRIMNMSSECPDSAAPVAGHIHGTQLEWQVLDKKHRHAVVCFPRG